MSSRHRPHHRLDVVLNLRPASTRDLPFSELDALYTHIFSTVDQQDIGTVLRILSFDIIFRNQAPIKDIERILRLDAGDVSILLCDLVPVIGYYRGYSDGTFLKILHASLSDYLLDHARSNQYYIDTTIHCAEHVVDCLQFLSNVRFGDPTRHTISSAIYFFGNHCHSIDLTESLHDALKFFSIRQIYRSALISIPEPEDHVCASFHPFTFHFLPALFGFLKKLDHPLSVQLLKQHQMEYDLFLRECLKEYPHEDPLSMVLALISIHWYLPIGAFRPSLRLFDCTLYSDHLDWMKLRLYLIRHADLGYMQYLSEFLHDPTRSREFAAPVVFAQASIFCLNYLCDHRAFEKKIPSRTSPQQHLRRLYTPWKWHRRVIREDIRGWRVTPWLWLRRPTRLTDVSQTRVLHRKVNDLIYISTPNLCFSGWDYNDPVVMHRINTEKYYLALTYLIHFLPQAVMLDKLVHMCQRLTFASRSRLFPRESARARSCMQKYAAQWQ